MNITKKDLWKMLNKGIPLNEIFNFIPGQDCEIYKAVDFDESEMDDIIYIPDTNLNEIYVDSTVYYTDEIENILGNCYTKNDFIEECNGNEKMAADLFGYVDWQHPCVQDLLDGYDESDSEEFYRRYGCSLSEFE